MDSEPSKSTHEVEKTGGSKGGQVDEGESIVMPAKARWKMPKSDSFERQTLLQPTLSGEDEYGILEGSLWVCSRLKRSARKGASSRSLFGDGRQLNHLTSFPFPFYPPVLRRLIARRSFKTLLSTNLHPLLNQKSPACPPSHLLLLPSLLNKTERPTTSSLRRGSP